MFLGSCSGSAGMGGGERAAVAVHPRVRRADAWPCVVCVCVRVGHTARHRCPAIGKAEMAAVADCVNNNSAIKTTEAVNGARGDRGRSVWLWGCDGKRCDSHGAPAVQPQAPLQSPHSGLGARGRGVSESAMASKVPTADKLRRGGAPRKSFEFCAGVSICRAQHQCLAHRGSAPCPPRTSTEDAMHVRRVAEGFVRQRNHFSVRVSGSKHTPALHPPPHCFVVCALGREQWAVESDDRA